MASTNTVLASSNPGKLQELQLALQDTGLTLVTQDALGVTAAVEDGQTFIENALKKARHAALHTGLPAIADDSGLVVPALDGEPGIHSARYSGRGDAGNNAKLLSAMAELSGDDRSAWYFCVLVLLRSASDPAPLIAEGHWHGWIAEEPRGTGGFGYDPLFRIDDQGKTAAQLEPLEKQQLSHRGLAVARLRHLLDG
ncbi:MAG: RdgB/HAM1 family non-canonical purine NTP pyrophosphatase [Cellvibrionales bacterium]